MNAHAALVCLAKVSILREAPPSSLCLFAFCTLQKDVVNLKLESNFKVAFFFLKARFAYKVRFMVMLPTRALSNNS